MRARWVALVLAWCAGAAAAPTAPTAAPTALTAAPTTLTAAPTAPTAAPTAPIVPTAACEPLQLAHTSHKPPNVLEWEAAAVHGARALSDLVERGEATEAAAAGLARTLAATPLAPPPHAVAVGAPRQHIGVLYLAEPPTLVVFQQNNSAALQHYWRTLASAWNSSSVVWSPTWLACEPAAWWGGVAAARGAWPVRAAAAIFRRMPGAACEPAMHRWWGGPPRCDSRTTECQAIPTYIDGQFILEYECKCRPTFWHALGEDWLPMSAADPLAAPLDAPLACQQCARSGDAAACLPALYRVALLSANITGVLLCLIIAIIIFKKRKCKAVAMGMWTVLEVVILGALLMYASAAAQHLPFPRWRCVAGAWLRELGFVASYGCVVLRLWVLLAEFRTRKAHRWTPRDAEVLRIVAAMLIGAACYLAAFSAMGRCACGAAWHHVTAGGELLLLLAGLRIAFAARNANVPFQERGWLSLALCVELASGCVFRAAAAAGAAPERAPLAATLRAQLSAGAALGCVLAPRLWHAYRARSLAQEVSRRGPAEGFAVEGEEEPTSEEVRAELKRLYVQLEILRNKTLRTDNPHISKRRGGRKPPHRRFSLQALQARRGGKGKASSSAAEPSEAGDASRTPEDSVCSNEGPSHYTDGDQA